jgi:hypothetical protein
MAISNPLYNLNPVIECVDVESKNPRDHTRVTFTVKGDAKEIIKWCRRNFGDRGDGWDFVGGTKHVQLIIWSSKLLVMWELWQE